jgi:hypothetical protein
MKPTIYLAFVDDWELSGNGSGDARELQFRPMQELVGIFNAHAVHGSFNAEVMQQLTFRKFETEHPELKLLADGGTQTFRRPSGRGTTYSCTFIRSGRMRNTCRATGV